MFTAGVMAAGYVLGNGSTNCHRICRSLTAALDLLACNIGMDAGTASEVGGTMFTNFTSSRQRDITLVAILEDLGTFKISKESVRGKVQ